MEMNFGCIDKKWRYYGFMLDNECFYWVNNNEVKNYYEFKILIFYYLVIGN